MKNNKYYLVYAEINLDAIVKNVDNLMALTKENTGALAVVKADGYGHGDVAVAKAVAQKVTGYAVATLDEAVNLRENGVKKPILVLGYVDPYEFDILVSHEITARSEEHTSELQSRLHLVCRLLLEKTPASLSTDK